ncbi:hypothetical protein [Desulfobotulus mexicanus]|nr:hypothetical protein [Desulfobotulus mexicanus]
MGPDFNDAGKIHVRAAEGETAKAFTLFGGIANAGFFQNHSDVFSLNPDF